jgi:hypothetical protein
MTQIIRICTDFFYIICVNPCHPCYLCHLCAIFVQNYAEDVILNSHIINDLYINSFIVNS